MSKGIVHIYGQSAHHMDAIVLGNKAGLEALRDAITVALSAGVGCNDRGSTDVYVNDGEEYTVYVKRLDDTDKLTVPYIADYAQDKSGKKLPGDIYNEP